ncbi:MAG: TRAP transporter small permease [Planctomycetota bacterium]|jgi:TRAP-type C4-dicarboxylate transport system permease small subunit|nr:TRAP transporter small permease [Planctomycetota bacterium]
MADEKPGGSVFLALQEWLGLAFFAVMCVLLLLQLISRYFFSRPLLFTEEFSRFCYVWIAFIGLAVAHRRNDHIRIDLFVGWLPERARRIWEAAVAVASIAILGCLGWRGVEYLFFNAYSVASSVDFPLYYVYAALPAGCVLGIANLACRLFARPRDGGRAEREQ